MGERVRWLYRSEHPVRCVAFYDRASTAPQATNGMRGASADIAVAFAAAVPWALIPSGDRRSDGVCWLDVESGESFERPAFRMAFEHPLTDAVVAIYLDRIARSRDVLFDALDLAEHYGKSLGVLERLELGGPGATS